MSVVASNRIRRRPRLKVVGGPVKPRRQFWFSLGQVDFYAVEFWSEAEWAALAEHERPDDCVIRLAGTGVFHVRAIDKEESMEISDDIAAGNATYELMRGRGE